MKRFFALSAVLAVVVTSTACVRHIHPYKTKVRKYKPERYAASADYRESGSLWARNTDTLFTHRRSVRVGDLITVMIKEAAAAQRDAETDLKRSSEMAIGVDAFMGAMAALAKAHPSVDPSKLIAAKTKNDFSGKGSTSRSGKVEATLTARIKQVLPNGDLYIEGSKVVLINDEESHLYLSGVVRPSDLEADNSVVSSLVADLQVEYTGRGPLAEKNRPGWFSRLLDFINPF